MNKRKIIQFCLVGISTATILEFHQHDISFGIKLIATTVLMVINCVYNYRMGIKDGIKISNSHNERMNELRKQSFDKIVDMVAEEKANDKSGGVDYRFYYAIMLAYLFQIRLKIDLTITFIG